MFRNVDPIISAIANKAVKPGDSMPNKFIRPVMSFTISFLIIKSAGFSVIGFSFGRIPE